MPVAYLLRRPKIKSILSLGNVGDTLMTQSIPEWWLLGKMRDGENILISKYVIHTNHSIWKWSLAIIQSQEEKKKKCVHPERLPDFVTFNSFLHSFSTTFLTPQSLFLPSFSYPGSETLPMLAPQMLQNSLSNCAVLCYCTALWFFFFDHSPGSPPILQTAWRQEPDAIYLCIPFSCSFRHDIAFSPTMRDSSPPFTYISLVLQFTIMFTALIKLSDFFHA